MRSEPDTGDPEADPATHPGSEHADAALVERPPSVPVRRRPFGARTMAVTYAGGFLMGSADIVPGVSGGTVALVLGIYERLVAEIRQGARAASLLIRLDVRDGIRALRLVSWSFLLPLLAGVATAIATLASGLEHLLENEPVLLAAAFAGLIVGSVAVSLTEIHDHRPGTWAVVVASAAATFLLLGLRTGRFEDPSLLIAFGGGMLAVCAMILPGVSGSFILLMIGLYEFVLGAVSDRDVLTIAAVGAGAIAGLGTFSTLLNWLLSRYHDVVLAALIGLMIGSLRVLWPWPAGEEGIGDTTLGAPVAGEVLPAAGLAVLGFLVVLAVAGAARALSEADD